MSSEEIWERGNTRRQLFQEPEMGHVDMAKVVVGRWVRRDGSTWSFEPHDGEDNSQTIKLYLGMKYSELHSQVCEKLIISAEESLVKLSYQWPEWMLVEEPSGPAPQYIVSDDDMIEFVQMRREIEEVDLFVTIVNKVTDCEDCLRITEGNEVFQATEPVTAHPYQTGGHEVDLDWHDFALDTAESVAENQNPKKRRRADGDSQRGNGIVIREGGQKPVKHVRVVEGKGKAIMDEYVAETDSSDEEGTQIDIYGNMPRGYNCRGEFIGSQGSGGTFENTSRYSSSPDEQDTTSEEETSDDEYTLGAASASPISVLPPWTRAREALHAMLASNGDEPPLFGRDAPPVFECDGVDGVEGALDDVAYEGDNLFVGKVFKSKMCKLKVAIHSINRRYHIRTIRSNRTFMVFKCYTKTCQWRVYAVRVQEGEEFQIRSANLTHTCSVDERRNYHKLATTQVIGELMQAKYVCTKTGPRPADIKKYLLDEFHVNISYFTAWRGREVAMENARGSAVGNYVMLPNYIAHLQNANPGTICASEFTQDGDGGRRFKYQFISLGACNRGYVGMRPVIVVDGTHCTGRYGVCLLSVVCQDGNYQIFSIGVCTCG